MKHRIKRNLMAFEAPLSLTEKTKQIADVEMCSTSAICRKALAQYITAMETQKMAEQYAAF